MRVVFVHPFAQQLSGPDESLLALLEPLSQNDIEIHLVVPRLGPLAKRYRALGVVLHVLPLTILHRRMQPVETVLFGPRLAMQTARLAWLLRSLRADVVHTNMEVVLEGGLAARLVGLPHVLHYRGNSLDSPKRLFDLLTFLWTSFADRVFCISNATAEIFWRRGYTEKVEVLYNPVDLAAFAMARRSDEVRATLGAGPGQPLVMTMGRIHPRKDMETFVRACARIARSVPEARFAIVGSADGLVEQEYLARVKAVVAQHRELENRLTFAGARTDVAAVMKAADVFVLSSRHEGFGRVVAEAMAASTAVVATREGALPELIDEPRFGLGATAKSDVEFSEQILTLLRHPAHREQLGVASTERARLFDAHAVVERVRRCYDDLLRETRRNSRRKADPRLRL